MENFPADVLPRKCYQKFSDSRRYFKISQFFGSVLKSIMITRKILPTSFMLDCLPIGYSLIDFQPIWNNFKIEIFFGIWVYSSGPTITQKRSKKDVVAVARISDHSALPSSARSEASISFQIQCCKIWKGRRSCCEFFQLQIALNP